MFSPGRVLTVARHVGAATQYIRRFLMEKAKAGLLAGQTVSEVSQALGFDYPQHFTRMFKREFGIAPSALRNSAGAQ